MKVINPRRYLEEDFAEHHVILWEVRVNEILQGASVAKFHFDVQDQKGFPLVVFLIIDPLKKTPILTIHINAQRRGNVLFQIGLS